MIVAPGTRLGPYEIVSPIGAGGMGEVWKARDTRLDRSVAIKVLPAEFAGNAQLRLRFEREAKTISQLNHPNICTLYDVGDGYLVMELLDGEPLADRIARGPLPLDQVLRHGIEIAEALEKAHKAGIVHRDLKPGNVMITKSGAKLLDFGLAKPSEQGVLSELTSVRTEQKKSLTEEGTIVGTFQYMAPEQIEGSEVDARTDIFALGALLYEMATGRRAFEGKSKASLIATILTADPQPISAIQPLTPASFERIVKTCLRKDPDARWQNAHDVAEALRAVAEEGTAVAVSRPARGRTLGWLVAVAAAAALAAIAGWALHRPVPPPVLHVRLVSPPGSIFVPTSMPAIAPDESAVGFAAMDIISGRPSFWIESLRTGEVRRIPNTEGADDPSWSPDGSRIAFVDDSEQLRVVSLRDGSFQNIASVPSPNGTTWLNDDEVIIASERRGLSRLSVNGGAPAEFVRLHPGDVQLVSPVRIGEGTVAFRVTTPRLTDRRIDIRLADGTVKTLTQAELGPFPSPPGTLLFGRRGEIFSQRLDAKRGVLLGRPRSVGRGSRAAATQSLLCYVAAVDLGRSKIVISDRTGHQTDLIPPDYMVSFRLSPDGRSLAYEHGARGVRDIWIYEIETGRSRRVTFNPADEFDVAWTADSESIVYSSTRDGAPNIYTTTVAGTGVEKRVVASPDTKLVDDVSSSGRVVYVTENGQKPGTLWTTSITGNDPPQPFLETPFKTAQAVFSPDGKHLAYKSDEAGVEQVFVIDYPAAAHKWQVSISTGSAPKWSHDGKELYFLANGTLFEVPMRNTSGEIAPGTPRALFGGIPLSYTRDYYEPMPDGRFLVLVGARDAAPEMHIVTERLGE